MRRIAGNVFIEYRGWLELTVALVVVAVFLLSSTAENFPETLNEQRRGSLYASLAGTTGALLGFVLAGLAILVALPPTERIEALKEHPRWERVPSAYFRAARALLAALVLSTLGIALDSAKSPWEPYEAFAVAAVTLALVRVAAAVVALDQVVAVARQDALPDTRIDDPGL